jgi:hypothetical protein
MKSAAHALPLSHIGYAARASGTRLRVRPGVAVGRRGARRLAPVQAAPEPVPAYSWGAQRASQRKIGDQDQGNRSGTRERNASRKRRRRPSGRLICLRSAHAVHGLHQCQRRLRGVRRRRRVQRPGLWGACGAARRGWAGDLRPFRLAARGGTARPIRTGPADPRSVIGPLAGLHRAGGTEHDPGLPSSRLRGRRPKTYAASRPVDRE